MGDPTPVRGVMVDLKATLKVWKNQSEAKARYWGLRMLEREGVGVNCIEDFLNVLEGNTRSKEGQGREDKVILRFGMKKILKDCRRNMVKTDTEKKKERQFLCGQVWCQ